MRSNIFSKGPKAAPKALTLPRRRQRRKQRLEKWLLKKNTQGSGRNTVRWDTDQGAKLERLYSEAGIFLLVGLYVFRSILIVLFCLPKKEPKKGPGKRLHPFFRVVP